MLQMLELLHSRGHRLGAVLPDRILLHVKRGNRVFGVSLLDDTKGETIAQYSDSS